ncbi:hypothetical protein Dsin_000642 [Dipteronia sinensis]|uniref:Endonuclease/exonuclease/phosphatase domain-containing protein n=1 Tax=Dipteronia sinensis TaxID=43782 RepID=A0AAE0B2A4_9ROSI|nr:hypothetical protein Dsin_000642 [Dipteronia sinensis]
MRELWGFMVNVQQYFDRPWIMRGDFNTISNESERRGGGFNKWSAKAFNIFILQAKVIDMPVHGITFSWSNNRENGSWARLDRFLVSPVVLTWFPDMVQRGLPRSISDHGAITLGVVKDFWGPRPFRFNNEWLKDRDLMTEIQNQWEDRSTTRSSSFILHSKLRRSKFLIKRKVFSRKKDVSTTKALEEWLAKVDEKAVSIDWTEEL